MSLGLPNQPRKSSSPPFDEARFRLQIASSLELVNLFATDRFAEVSERANKTFFSPTAGTLDKAVADALRRFCPEAVVKGEQAPDRALPVQRLLNAIEILREKPSTKEGEILRLKLLNIAAKYYSEVGNIRAGGDCLSVAHDIGYECLHKFRFSPEEWTEVHHQLYHVHMGLGDAFASDYHKNEFDSSLLNKQLFPNIGEDVLYPRDSSVPNLLVPGKTDRIISEFRKAELIAYEHLSITAVVASRLEMLDSIPKDERKKLAAASLASSVRQLVVELGLEKPVAPEKLPVTQESWQLKLSLLLDVTLRLRETNPQQIALVGISVSDVSLQNLHRLTEGISDEDLSRLKIVLARSSLSSRETTAGLQLLNEALDCEIRMGEGATPRVDKILKLAHHISRKNSNYTKAISDLFLRTGEIPYLDFSGSLYNGALRASELKDWVLSTLLADHVLTTPDLAAKLSDAKRVALYLLNAQNCHKMGFFSESDKAHEDAQITMGESSQKDRDEHRLAHVERLKRRRVSAADIVAQLHMLSSDPEEPVAKQKIQGFLALAQRTLTQGKPDEAQWVCAETLIALEKFKPDIFTDKSRVDTQIMLAKVLESQRNFRDADDQIHQAVLVAGRRKEDHPELLCHMCETTGNFYFFRAESWYLHEVDPRRQALKFYEQALELNIIYSCLPDAAAIGAFRKSIKLASELGDNELHAELADRLRALYKKR